MADSPTIQGNYPDGSIFKFSLDGVTTHAQMERLIKLTGTLAKKFTKNDPAEKERIELLEKGNKLYKEQGKQQRETNKEFDKFQDSLENASAVTGLFKGHLLSSIRAFDTPLAKMAAGMGGVVAGLMNYADDLRPALQRGIAGGVLDFAVSAKGAGLTLGEFNKALAATGGTFTQLGDGATGGSKAFGRLVNDVRLATASVGNLGMSNEQLAEFTGQQLKIAVQQGLKGKQAQDSVIRTTKTLGTEFDNLADRTGKTIQEMAEAAAKLVSDPTVSSFLATLGKGADKASAAMQAVGANMTAMFGKTGEKFANEAAQAAASNLPLAFSKMGQQMAGFAPALYGETERQMKRAAAGFMPTEQDRKKMLDAALEAERTQGDSLRAMAAMGGEAGEAAKNILAMAQEARGYNSDANKEKRAREKAAQEFNSEVNKLSANLNQLAVPFLQLLNGIDWTMMFQVLNGFASVVKFALKPLEWLGSILGATGAGTLIGGFLGLVTVGTLLVSGFGMLGKALKGLVDVITSTITKLGLISTATGAGRAAPAAAGVGKQTTGFAGLASREKELASARAQGRPTGFDTSLKERSDELYKKYRAEGSTPMEAKRRADAHAAMLPQANAAEKLAKAAPMVEKFAGAIAGVTTALVGTGMVIAGEALLREDANSKLGQFLVTWGNVIGVVGTLTGIVLQLAPAILGASKAISAYMALHGGALPALTAFIGGLWTSAKTLAGSFVSGLITASSTLFAAGKSLVTTFATMAVTVYQTVIPALIAMARSAWTSAAGSFGNLGKVLGPVAGWFARLGPWLASVGGILLNWGTKLLPLLGGAFEILSGPVGWLILAATLLYTFWDDLVDISKSLWQGLKNLSGWIAGGAKAIWEGLKGAGTWLGDKFKGIWDTVSKTMSGAFSSIGSWLGDKFKGIWDTVSGSLSNVVSSIGSWLGETMSSLMGFLSAPFKYVGELLTSVGEKISSGAKAIWDTITKPFTALYDWLKSSWLGKKLLGDDDKKKSSLSETVQKDQNNKLAVLSAPTDRVAATDPAYWQQESGKVNSELTRTQTSAIDEKSMKDNEQTKQLVALNKNMEALVDSSDANLSLQGKNVSVNEGNGRYLRQRSMFGTSAA